MERLKLSNGLVAIGYGGISENKDQTKFSLRLANQLAEKENVLFLNWNHYSRKLENIIKKLGIEKNQKLEINTSVEYFGLSSFLNIAELIESNGFTTIFIDNVFSYTSEKTIHNEFGERNLLIKSLRFLAERYSVRIIFNVAIDPDSTAYEYYAENIKTDLGYFRWSRKIMNDCNQVLAVYNLASSINGETEEPYPKNTFKVFDLKNEEDETENYIIEI